MGPFLNQVCSTSLDFKTFPDLACCSRNQQALLALPVSFGSVNCQYMLSLQKDTRLRGLEWGLESSHTHCSQSVCGAGLHHPRGNAIFNCSAQKGHLFIQGTSRVCTGNPEKVLQWCVVASVIKLYSSNMSRFV